MHKRLWIALVCVLGCGDDGDGSGDAGGTSAASTCTRGCTRAAAANCPNQPSDCQQQCEAQINATPTSCIGAVSAYSACVNTAVFSCDSTGVAEAASCSAQLAAWQACLGGGPVVDASTPPRDAGSDAAPPAQDAAVQDAALPDAAVVDASEPDTGTASVCLPSASDVTCDACLKQRCCSSLEACTGDCLNLLNCANACTTDECTAACRGQYPGGLSSAQAIYTCMAAQCANECAIELGN